MKNGAKKESQQGVAEGILGKMDKIIPGFHGFFKKVEGSKTFGPRIAEIRKEIEKRFGKVKSERASTGSDLLRPVERRSR